MIIRDIDKSDFDVIKKLNEAQDFRLNHLGNAITDKIVYDEHGVVAYGIVKRLGEAIILVNPSASKVNRARALVELMKEAEFGSVQAGLEQLHCFVSDEHIAIILEKHFGFVRTKDIVLVKNLG